jgi:hypothetical protein
MAETVIEWDGTNVPPELRRLAPGRYIVSPAQDGPLSPEEDAAVREGLDALEAGEVVTLEDVMREFESPSHRH